MYGSNYYGKAYYGQGPAVGTTFILKSVTGTVTTVAAISSILLITKIVTATVTTTGLIARQIQRSFIASVATTGTIAGLIVKALNVRRTTTKFLTLANTTRSLDDIRVTKELNLTKFTKDTTDD